ncbi:MAG: DUF2793 domain-containing protein, partial [Hyphomicrobiales bacterium]
MSETPRLGLTYLEAAQAQKHVTLNEALRRLDVLVQITVLDRDLATPPATPANGSCYLVPSGATGVFAGHEGAVAAFQDGAWTFMPAGVGWLVFVADENRFLVVEGPSLRRAFQPTETAIPSGEELLRRKDEALRAKEEEAIRLAAAVETAVRESVEKLRASNAGATADGRTGEGGAGAATPGLDDGKGGDVAAAAASSSSSSGGAAAAAAASAASPTDGGENSSADANTTVGGSSRPGSPTKVLA